jgi:hypothetical protein
MAKTISVEISASLAPQFRSALDQAGVKFRELDSTAKKAMDGAGQASQGLVGKLGGIGLALQGIQQIAGTVSTAIKTALAPSAEMETLRVQFAVLLGGMDAAKTRMEDLTQFANTTPFELPEVAKASKVLETLTRGALSTSDGLRLVGDTAAATGQPFDELAVWVGRLYDGLDSGRPVGEALARLQELGVMSGDVRGQIEALQKEGKKGPEVWAVAEASLGKFGGMMEAQSATAAGLASTFQDSVNQILRDFGDQVLPDASGAMRDATAAMADLKPAAETLGWVVSAVVKVFRVAFLGLQSFFSGLIPLVIGELGRLLSWSLSTMIGWAEKINGIVGKLLPQSWQDGIGASLASAKSWTEGMGEYFSTVADESVGYLDTIATKMAEVYTQSNGIKVPTGAKSTGGGGGGGGDGKEGEGQAVVDYMSLSGTNKQHNALQDAAFSDYKKQEALLEQQEEQKRKERDAQDKARADAWRARWTAVSNAVAGGFGQVANQMTQLALRGDFSLKKLGKAFKDMTIGMIANMVQFVVETIAKALMLKAADALTGGMVSAVLGAGKVASGGGIGGMLSLPSFDVGTTSVPRDMVAQIHKGEMIVPANFADGLRRGDVALGGQGGGAPSARGTLVDLDSRVLDTLRRHGRALVEIQADQVANFAMGAT